MSNLSPTTTTEAQLGDMLDHALNALGDRCTWQREVRMVIWTPGNLGQATSGRVDRVLQLDDDGLLIGIEIKRAPQRAAELGHYAAQAASYAYGQVGAAVTTPAAWQHRQLHAVCLLTATTEIARPFLARHLVCSERLFGGFNVGWVSYRELLRGELVLRFCAGRFWSRQWGYNKMLINHRHRVGSGYGTAPADGERLIAHERLEGEESTP